MLNLGGSSAWSGERSVSEVQSSAFSPESQNVAEASSSLKVEIEFTKLQSQDVFLRSLKVTVPRQ